MTSGEWAEVDRVFLEASALAPAARGTFLDQACAAQPSLRAEVESLLNADLTRSGFLDLQPSHLAADLVETRNTGPATIGPFRILRLIGEGGMGTVYQAKQQTPHRIVALKVIKAGMASDQVLRRFEQESEALGRLQHPGIAQIYDAGTADSGFGPQPYFAMEFIEGLPLMDYATERPLSIPTKLELMAKVCDAVNHAHQRGIIHRDLKPGNILVEADAQPKILDFGVARVMDSDVLITRQTDLGQLIGTLAYMSPEQALGNPLELDIRSDVYALGVILYELLAGKLPYETNRGTLYEAVRAIREEDPARLGTLYRGYRGDIETIAAKALEKDKARRYASAGELAGDIRRHLADLPIMARPPSASYQLQKFSRRHKAVVIGTAGVLVALIAGVIVSTWQLVRARTAEHAALEQRDRAVAAESRAEAGQETARKERARAEQERNAAVVEKRRADSEAASAQAVNEFLEKDLLAQAGASRQSEAGAKPDPDLKVRTALDRAAGRIAGKFDKQPEVEASIRDTIGQTYLNLGLYPEARKQLERSLELRRRALGAADPKTLNTMGRVGQVNQEEGKYAQAEALFSQTLEIQRSVLGPEHPDTLTSMGNLATTYFSQGKYVQAETMIGRTLEIQRRVLGPGHPSTLNSMNMLSNIYSSQSKYPQAEAIYSRILEIKRRVLGPEHPSTLIGMNNLASTYARLGKYPQAAALFSETLEIKRRVLGPEHPRTLDGMDNLASTYSRLGKYLQAEALFSQTLEIRRRSMGAAHPATINNMGGLAGIYSLNGKYEQAETLFSQTLDIQRRVVGPEHPSTLGNMFGLAGTYNSQGKYAQAEALYGQTLEIQRRVLGPEHQFTMESVGGLAQVYQAQGKYAASEPFAREGVEIARKKHPDDWERFLAEALLGASLAGQKKFAEAEPLLLEGYRGMDARKDRIAVPDRYHLDRAREWIVKLYQAWGKPGEAAAWTKN